MISNSVTVLATKWRPKIFGDIIGQSHTISQLTSALDKGTLGHALIFCGTRGSGKTTTARLVAAHYNCEVCYPVEEPKVEGYGKGDAVFPILTTPIGVPGLNSPKEVEPCGKCKDCKMIRVGVHPSVMEIDAASNTGVDNIRELQSVLQYVTSGQRVVILDEAHMLSKNAFNCLLKTLEEPPPGVTIILCTTEPHKLLDTVKSRCQIYEFQEVDLRTLATFYEHIMKSENIKSNGLPTESLFSDPMSIAIKANGSVRDGLSILQKALSGEQEADNSKQYFELVGAIYNQDVITALDILQELRKAEESRVVIQTLEKWFYWCSLESFGMKTPVRDYFGESATSNFDLGRLQESFKTCLEIERNFTATPNSKIVLDMGILKLCM